MTETPTTFRERIMELSVKSVATIGLDAALVAMLLIPREIPDRFWYLVLGMNLWIIGAEALTTIAGLGKTK